MPRILGNKTHRIGKVIRGKIGEIGTLAFLGFLVINFNRPGLKELQETSKQMPTLYQTCIHNMTTRRMPELISFITQNPNINGLKPTCIPSTNYHEEECIQGLNPDIFRRKRIAFMGDSTLFYPTKYLHMLLNITDKQRVTPSWENMTLEEGQDYVKQSAAESGIPPWPLAPPEFKKEDEGTFIEWMGTKGPNQGKTEEMLKSMFLRAEQINPEIIVANMG